MPGVQEISAIEHMGTTGKNLLLLFDLKPESEILLIGENLSAWRRYFVNARLETHIPSFNNRHPEFGLIIYQPSMFHSPNLVYSELVQLHSLLTKGGYLLLFVENPFCLKRIKDLLLRRVSFKLNNIWYFFIRYQCILKKTGFSFVQSFLPLPQLKQPEELVSTRSVFVSHKANPIINFYNILAGSTLHASGQIFLCSAKELSSGYFLDTITSEISNFLMIPVRKCFVERINIRIRGALVLFITVSETSQCFICRIVPNVTVDKIVSKNHIFLEYLHKDIQLPTNVTCNLPKPIRRLQCAEGICYIETMVSGILAWKVKRAHLQSTIFRETVDFLIAIYFASKKKSILCSELLDALFVDDLNRLNNCPVIVTDFLSSIKLLIDQLKNRLLGREIDLVISHGDYGYGNILVDPHTGKLTGVIDWDTGKKTDLPGIDMMNLLVQKERALKSCSVLPAFTAIVNTAESDSKMPIFHQFLKKIIIPEDLYEVICYISFIRYLTRAAQYPQVFLEEQEEYRKILQMLKKTMPL